MASVRVGVIGKPNVGKSSLINSVFQKQLSITSSKPQTTRNQLFFSFQDENFNIGFFDTPGYHVPKNKLDKFLNFETRKTLKNLDVCLFLFDPTRPWDAEDDLIIKELVSYKIQNVVLVITKKDLLEPDQFKEAEDAISKKYNFSNICFFTKDNPNSIKELLTIVKKYADLNLDKIDYKESDSDDNLIICETVRQVIIDLCYHEIPYSVAITIDKKEYNKEKNIFKINLSIVVEKESQKSILIGKNGSMIKNIGIESRKLLETIYDSKIVLLTNVKTKKDWRNNETFLKEVGYK